MFSSLRKPARGSADQAPPSVFNVIRSSGQPLDDGTRTHFEQKFGHDFTGVRVHSDSAAGASAREVGAAAYAVGNHVVFSEPFHGTGRQRSLLGHELVHVAQWGSRPVPSTLPISAPSDPTERAAAAGNLGAAMHQPALHRAAFICDEWEARETGTAQPGPGINVNVSRPAKTATVAATLQVHGPEADATKASTIQSTINSNWNGTFPDGSKIATTANVTHRAANAAAAANATQIELVRPGAGYPSQVRRHWLVGSRYARINLDDSAALSWTIAHEFGHLLGLADRYSESIWSRIAGVFWGGQRTAVPDPGYQNNIMAVDRGRLESSNVYALIAQYTGYRCVRGHHEPY